MAAWYGSKAPTGPCQAIVAAMPPHDVWIEPFLGGGAIMRRKPPARRSIGIDLNRRAIDGFRCDCPVELHHGCAHRFLSGFDFQGRELVCCDPPCVRSTRRGPRRDRFDVTDDDHVALLGLLKSLPCQVMVSGCPSAPYDEHLDGWRALEVQVDNQACVVTEKLWLNFGPGRPHWHACAGRDCTDRQRIKRNAESGARTARCPGRSTPCSASCSPCWTSWSPSCWRGRPARRAATPACRPHGRTPTGPRGAPAGRTPAARGRRRGRRIRATCARSPSAGGAATTCPEPRARGTRRASRSTSSSKPWSAGSRPRSGTAGAAAPGTGARSPTPCRARFSTDPGSSPLPCTCSAPGWSRSGGPRP